EHINRIIFKVFNQTRQILYLEYIKKAIQTVSIGIGIYYLDLRVLMIGFVITSILGYFINYYFSRKIIDSDKSQELYNLLRVSIVSIVTSSFILYILEVSMLQD